ncbi:hypothetical protein BDL97_07G112500 [Sphagnum fallax]|nr:hypothetical protein BDL97_07G112500 [Sphagnum fallax]KAH8957847.1 hypothetical protein BDL97_07G112500 [Sphagnum fallax]KAH8957850.1 hypothetical protein BDL97_07G112500 [Sphagnum fallax]
MLETDEGEQAAYNYAPGCSCDDTSGEELGLAVLPRHTKVLVTGNNRTKSVLLGHHGVVKKAVGLGGWHWLVLTNGDQVKLQRNALSVIEVATGQEEEEEDDDIQENLFFSGNSLEDGYLRTFKTCGQHQKSTVQSAVQASARDGNDPVADHPAAVFEHSIEKKAGDANEETSRSSKTLSLTVDFSKLETAALRRYQRHFKLVEVGQNSSKQQLLDAVGKHFMSQEMDEFQVITGFMQAAKRLKS